MKSAIVATIFCLLGAPSAWAGYYCGAAILYPYQAVEQSGRGGRFAQYFKADTRRDAGIKALPEDAR